MTPRMTPQYSLVRRAGAYALRLLPVLLLLGSCEGGNAWRDDACDTEGPGQSNELISRPPEAFTTARLHNAAD